MSRLFDVPILPVVLLCVGRVRITTTSCFNISWREPTYLPLFNNWSVLCNRATYPRGFCIARLITVTLYANYLLSHHTLLVLPQYMQYCRSSAHLFYMTLNVWYNLCWFTRSMFPCRLYVTGWQIDYSGTNVQQGSVRMAYARYYSRGGVSGIASTLSIYMSVVQPRANHDSRAKAYPTMEPTLEKFSMLTVWRRLSNRSSFRCRRFSRGITTSVPQSFESHEYTNELSVKHTTM